MIIYNVTVKVDLSVHEEWLNWMKSIHIPEVMDTGLFLDNKFLKLLEQDETDGITYAIQYFCRSMDDFHKYNRNFASELQLKHTNKFNNKTVAFRTLLEEI